MGDYSKEIRIATIGQVDSGKSTILGILSNPKNKNNIIFLDDGRGSARKNVFKHKHEQLSGRTSSATYCYTQLNKKNFSFIDLAGHEKYLSTTMKGISGGLPDYVMAIISCNKNNIPRITKEHLGLAIAYNIPIIIIITKIDMPNIELKLQKIEEKITCIMSSRAASYKKILKINNIDNVIKSVKKFNQKDGISYCPVFKVSNTSGKNLSLLKEFLQNLSPNRKTSLEKKQKLFLVNDVFHISGVGVVVTGIQKRGEIRKGDKLFIGPINNKYRKIIIKTIHDNYQNFIDVLYPLNSGCFWIKSAEKEKINKSLFRRGMVIVSVPEKYTHFDAEVSIMQHPTSIKLGYQPVIHTGNISQSAKIIKICNGNQITNILRSGDTGKISFKFLYYPVFIEKDNTIIFREGKTKGIGKIISVY